MRLRGWERMNKTERIAWFVGLGAFLLQLLLFVLVAVLNVPHISWLSGLLWAVLFASVSVTRFRQNRLEGILYGIGTAAIIIIWLFTQILG